jgi:hypothetical protein
MGLGTAVESETVVDSKAESLLPSIRASGRLRISDENMDYLICA